MDFIVAEVSHPSTRIGIELGFGYMYGKSILAIYKQGSKISNPVRNIASRCIEYKNINDAVSEIEKIIFEKIR